MSSSDSQQPVSSDWSPSLDGRPPARAVVPASEERCQAEVLAARADGMAVVVWGGGTAVEFGNPLRAGVYCALLTRGLTGVTEYSPADMVVTARAGTTLAELQDVLAEHRQFLPIDAPGPDRTTLGGVVATNAQGLWRPAFGAPRDRLLALRVVLADGEVVKGGAKVVKNVAGYDLCKLFAGSWGTLGVITEVTFKTNPRPEAAAHVCYRAPSLSAAVEAGLSVYSRHLEPAYLVAAGGPPWHLCAGFLGGAEAIAWHQAEVNRLVLAAGLDLDPSGPGEHEVRMCTASSSAPLRARLSVRPTDLPGAACRVERAAAAQVVAHVASGIVDVAFEGDGAALVAAAEVVEECARPAGTVTWRRVPDEWRATRDAWGAPRGDMALMRAIKAALDPDGLFSPGRFAGRL